MNIEEKFQKGAVSKTYQRIDADYKVNIYLGYNDDGFMSMVITEFGKESLVKSSKLINVTLKKREDKKLALSFDLLDNSYKSMFYIFCKDIINVCEKGGSQMAISNALTRWKYWKNLFGKNKSSVLSKFEIKGLIGELLVLRDSFFTAYSQTAAIQSWMGPLMGHKDFEIDNTWYEVKSVTENAVQVTISSLEQLDSDVDGHLIVVRLEDSSLTSGLAINLNETVLSIVNLIDDPEDLELFQTRLNNMGYLPDSEYDNYAFVFKGKSMYKVNSAFPRITRDKVNDSIGNVQYTVMLNGLESFKED